jgi:hypothetical protein
MKKPLASYLTVLAVLAAAFGGSGCEPKPPPNAPPTPKTQPWQVDNPLPPRAVDLRVMT